MHYYDYSYGYGPDMMYGYGGFDGIWHILFIVLVVLGIFVLARMFMRGCKHGRCMWHGGQSAVGILEERFAKGEIDKAEFEERRKALTGK